MSREDNIESVLKKWGKYVVQQARTNLTKGKRNSSKALYNSLSYEYKIAEDKFSLIFNMEAYGQFQDLGVKGQKTTYPESSESPYQYKDKMPPASAFANWVIRKGLKGTRNAKGQFVKRKGLQFAIAKSIQQEGIRATKFFSKPFGLAFNQLPPDVAKAFTIDPQDFE